MASVLKVGTSVIAREETEGRRMVLEIAMANATLFVCAKIAEKKLGKNASREKIAIEGTKYREAAEKAYQKFMDGRQNLEVPTKEIFASWFFSQNQLSL